MSTMLGSLCLLQNLPFCSPTWLNLALVLQSSVAQTLTMTQLRLFPSDFTGVCSSRFSMASLLSLNTCAYCCLEGVTSCRASLYFSV